MVHEIMGWVMFGIKVKICLEIVNVLISKAKDMLGLE